LQGHVVLQFHASSMSPRIRHEVSVAMTHLLLHYAEAHNKPYYRHKAAYA
jgi:hypothetical protein